MVLSMKERSKMTFQFKSQKLKPRQPLDRGWQHILMGPDSRHSEPCGPSGPCCHCLLCCYLWDAATDDMYMSGHGCVPYLQKQVSVFQMYFADLFRWRYLEVYLLKSFFLLVVVKLDKIFHIENDGEESKDGEFDSCRGRVPPLFRGGRDEASTEETLLHNVFMFWMFRVRKQHGPSNLVSMCTCSWWKWA